MVWSVETMTFWAGLALATAVTFRLVSDWLLAFSSTTIIHYGSGILKCHKTCFGLSLWLLLKLSDDIEPRSYR